MKEFFLRIGRSIKTWLQSLSFRTAKKENFRLLICRSLGVLLVNCQHTEALYLSVVLNQILHELGIAESDGTGVVLVHCGNLLYLVGRKREVEDVEIL